MTTGALLLGGAWLGLPSTTEARAPDPAHALLPAVRAWKPAGGSLQLSKDGGSGALPVYFTSHVLAREARSLAADAEAVLGRRVQAYEVTACRPRSICLELGDRSARSHKELGPVAMRRLLQEGYRLAVNAKVTISASTPEGVYRGTRTLVQLMRQSDATLSLRKGLIDDWPFVGERIYMVDTARKFYSLNRLYQVVRRMSYLKMNRLHLHLTDWQAFRLRSPRFPGLAPATRSYTRSDIGKLTSFGRARHVEIIPEIDLPGHSSALTRYYSRTHPGKSISFSCPSMSSRKAEDRVATGWTLDVTKPEAIEFAERLVSTFAPWFSGAYFHIGADEYGNDRAMSECPEIVEACRGDAGCVRGDGTQSTGNLFVKFIARLDRTVRSRGKTTRIWSGWNEGRAFDKHPTSTIDPPTDVVVDHWLATDPRWYLDRGFSVANRSADLTYVTPGNIDRGRIPPIRWMSERWMPNVFTGDGAGLPDSDPRFLGAGVSVWGDRSTETDADIFDALAERPLAVMANAAWSGGPEVTPQRPGLSTLMSRAVAVGEPPGTPQRESRDWSWGEIPRSGRDASAVFGPLSKHAPASRLQGVRWTRSAGCAAVEFEGNAGEKVHLGLGALRPPWTVSAWIRRSDTPVVAPPGAASVLVAGPSGSINLANGTDGLTGLVNGPRFPDRLLGTFSFGYALPVDLWTLITVVGRPWGTVLYADGAYRSTTPAVIPLPLESVGSDASSFVGRLSNLSVLDRALDGSEIHASYVRSKPRGKRDCPSAIESPPAEDDPAGDTSPRTRR